MNNQEKIKVFFSSCRNAQEIYEKLIELGKKLPPFPSEEKRPEYLVPGCQSQVFLTTRCEEGKLFFRASSDALISAGLAALLIEIYNGQPPETVLSCPPTCLEELGIPQALTPGRSHGLSSIYLRFKQDALKFLVQ